jgi:hypothetical protein
LQESNTQLNIVGSVVLPCILLPSLQYMRIPCSLWYNLGVVKVMRPSYNIFAPQTWRLCLRPLQVTLHRGGKPPWLRTKHFVSTSVSCPQRIPLEHGPSHAWSIGSSVIGSAIPGCW